MVVWTGGTSNRDAFERCWEHEGAPCVFRASFLGGLLSLAPQFAGELGRESRQLAGARRSRLCQAGNQGLARCT